MRTIAVSRETDSTVGLRLLERLTGRLPQWFAQADANRHYSEQAEVLESWIAWIGRRQVGLLLLKRHAPAGAEIYWLGVDPDHHCRGVGRTLVGAVQRQREGEKVQFLFVMTLHPDVDYEPYQRTRAFYEQLGFTFALSTSHSPLGVSNDPLAWYLKPL